MYRAEISARGDNLRLVKFTAYIYLILAVPRGIFQDSTKMSKTSTRPWRAPAAVVFLLLIALVSTTDAAAAAGGIHRQTQQQQQDSSSIFVGSALESAITVSSLLEIDEECYAPLYQSDLDGDGRVDRDEYVVFVNAISDDYFASACRNNNPQKCNFDQLPLAVQSNFINLACLCERFGGADDCCVLDNAHIATDGAGPNDDPTNAQALYLFTVCRDTYTAVEEVRTPSPTIAPTKTPTTMAPTSSPTETPTAKPTGKPTRSPTIKPTRSPTANPTPSPTKKPPPPPTKSPVRITDDPTEAPSPTTTTVAPVSAPPVVVTPAPTASSPLITGPLPVSFGYTISNLQGYDASDVQMGTGGNTIQQDLEGALGILVPQVVEETFGTGQRRMQQMQLQIQQQQRHRKLLVEYDPSADPATVDSLEDIGEFIVLMCCVFYC